MRMGDLNSLRRFRSTDSRDFQHMTMVRQLWCALGKRDDQRQAIHAHRLQGGPCRLRGSGKRSKEAWLVPIEWFRHDELQALGSRHEREYFLDHSHGRVDPYALAQGLYSAGCNLRCASMILEAHQSQDRTLRLLSLSQAELTV